MTIINKLYIDCVSRVIAKHILNTDIHILNIELYLIYRGKRKF